jgi:hypothetical protein
MVLPSFTIVNIFLNPSWITFRSNCHGHPKSRWLPYIRTTSHITSSEYFLIANTIDTCIVTFTHHIHSTIAILPRMLNTTQIQFSHKSIISYISTTTSINYHATYLVLDVASSVKYVFCCWSTSSSLIWMFSANLITKASPSRKFHSLFYLLFRRTFIN